MPELPEVEIVRRGLNQVTKGCLIWGGEVLLRRTISHPIFAESFLDNLRHCEILQWHRRGKYLLAELRQVPSNPGDPEQTAWMGVHLRMTGQLLWVKADTPVQKHCRVRLWFADGQELRFVDQRTFGRMWWVPPLTPPEQVIGGLRKLGPEPLDCEFSNGYLMRKLKCSRRPIKNFLLDQGLIAGLGNIYADEALFMSQISPLAICHRLGKARVRHLYESIVQVLEDGIAAGGTTFSDFRDVRGGNGNYGGQAWVYGRYGEPCRICGTLIKRIKLAGRSAHFCPQCQS